MFSGPALTRIEDSPLEEVVVTDTIGNARKHPRITQLTSAEQCSQ